MEIIFRHERYLFSPSQVWRPATDIYESPDEVVIIVELGEKDERTIEIEEIKEKMDEVIEIALTDGLK